MTSFAVSCVNPPDNTNTITLEDVPSDITIDEETIDKSPLEIDTSFLEQDSIVSPMIIQEDTLVTIVDNSGEYTSRDSFRIILKDRNIKTYKEGIDVLVEYYTNLYAVEYKRETDEHFVRGLVSHKFFIVYNALKSSPEDDRAAQKAFDAVIELPDELWLKYADKAFMKEEEFNKKLQGLLKQYEQYKYMQGIEFMDSHPPVYTNKTWFIK